MVQAAQHQLLEPQDHLPQSMSLTHLYHVCGVKGILLFLIFRAALSLDQSKPTSEENYLVFVEEPSEDFFCPVTHSLLLQPYLTSCCGNHISQEAASRIQRKGGACPLCRSHPLSTTLNKHFQRQVRSLHVFCCYEDRGCEWQGEVARYEEHISSCPNKLPLHK